MSYREIQERIALEEKTTKIGDRVAYRTQYISSPSKMGIVIERKYFNNNAFILTVQWDNEITHRVLESHVIKEECIFNVKRKQFYKPDGRFAPTNKN